MRGLRDAGRGGRRSVSAAFGRSIDAHRTAGRFGHPVGCRISDARQDDRMSRYRNVGTQLVQMPTDESDS
ncbi:hypothetical protein [Burkholderia mayonis]|uniref:hypothetical protein n=1 Tax=Burkholderia mayonis TaxID=1385591 RepID=UPI000A5B602F|nr:hypothetical protein [Burkholderia mayonis]